MDNINYDNEILKHSDSYLDDYPECSMSPECNCEDCQKENIKMD